MARQRKLTPERKTFIQEHWQHFSDIHRNLDE